MKQAFDLTSLEWTLARAETAHEAPDWHDAIPAHVTGCVLDDLVRAGLAPDPFYGENFRACAWTGEWTFWYGARFTLAGLGIGPASYERATLCFDAIDTYAEVFLNDVSLGSVANQFKRHAFDVHSLLHADGPNHLVVRIDPVKKAFRTWFDKTRPDATGVTALFDDDRPWIRKSQMTFGWDNCPHLVAGGLTLPVRLETASGPVIEDLSWDVPAVDPERPSADLRLRGRVAHASAPGEIRVAGRCCESTFDQSVAVSPDGSWQITISVQNARLWWPHGLGRPDLYSVEVSYSEGSLPLDVHALRIGLRRVEVVTTPKEKRLVDYRIGRPAQGMHTAMDGGCLGPWERQPLPEPVEVEVSPFLFHVNGRRVFVKGYDWQAPDVLVGRITDEQLATIVKAMRDARCNLLRAWGGGAIERDSFYRLCDENGLMLWQDFFFACAVYPRDPVFLREVENEAEDIVKRLRNHTCLVAWCGDNESDMIEYDLGRDPSLNPINKRILPETLRRHDPQARHYHISSPSGGPYPRSDFSGDKRNWGPTFPQRNYWHIRQEEARFISEGGSKSFPSLETIRRSIPEAQRWPITTRTWRLHAGDIDGHVRGDYRNEPLCSAYFAETDNIEQAVVVSQFAQAWGAKLMAEQCRRRQAECGGMLYWKTADQWPCYDQGAFDYHGFPRPVYHWLREAFRPVLLSLTQDWRGDERGDLQLWLSCDTLHPVAGTVSLEAVLQSPAGELRERRLLYTGLASCASGESRRLALIAIPADCAAETTVYRALLRDAASDTLALSTYSAAPRAAYLHHVLGSRDLPGATVGHCSALPGDSGSRSLAQNSVVQHPTLTGSR